MGSDFSLSVTYSLSLPTTLHWFYRLW